MHQSDDGERVRTLLGEASQAALHGRFADAEKVFLAARALVETSGLGDSCLATCLDGLATLYTVLLRLAEAEPLYLDAIALFRGGPGPTHPFLGRLWTGLGNLRHIQGRLAEADDLLRQALALLEKAPAEYRGEQAVTLMRLGSLCKDTGRRPEALACEERGLALIEESEGPESPLFIMGLRSLGFTCHATGDNVRARQLLERCLGLARKTGFEESPVMVRTFCFLADVCRDEGRLPEMAQLLKRALTLAVRCFGERHLEVTSCLDRLCVAFRERRKFGPARRFAERSLATKEAIHGACHIDVAYSLHELGMVAFLQDKDGEAGTFFRRARAVGEKVWGPYHPDRAVVVRNLGVLAYRAGRLDEAVQLCREAMMVWEELYGPHHARTVSAREAYLTTLREVGRDAEAEAEEARAAAAAAQPPPSPAGQKEETADPAELERRWVELLKGSCAARDAGDLDGAAQLLTDALELLTECATLDRRHGKTHLWLADVRSRQAKPQEAREHLRRAALLLDKAADPEDEELANALTSLASLRAGLGEAPAAEVAYRRALAIYDKAGQPPHREGMRVKCYLTAVLASLGRRDEAAALARQGVAQAEGLAELNADELSVLHALARKCEPLGEDGAAELAYRHCLAEAERLHGDSHETVMYVAFSLAGLLVRLGRDTEAVPLTRQAVAIAARAKPAPLPVAILWRLIELCDRLGEAETGVQLRRLHLTELERQHGAEHMEVMEAAFALGQRLVWQGRWAEAEPFCRRALAIGRTVLRGDEGVLGGYHYWLAGVCEQLGQRSEAAALARRAAAIADVAAGARTLLPDPLRSLAGLCDRLGETDAAVQAYRRCLADLERDRGPSHADLLPVLDEWAALYTRLGRHAEAAPLAWRRLGVAEKALPPEHTGLVEGLRAHVACCIEQRDYLAGLSACLRLLVSLERLLGPAHPQVASVLDVYAGVSRRIGNSIDADLMEARARAIRNRPAS